MLPVKMNISTRAVPAKFMYFLIRLNFLFIEFMVIIILKWNVTVSLSPVFLILSFLDFMINKNHVRFILFWL